MSRAVSAPIKTTQGTGAFNRLLYRRLAFCRIAAVRWKANGNHLWAGNYRLEAEAVRRKLDSVRKPKARPEPTDDLRRQIASWLVPVEEEDGVVW